MPGIGGDIVDRLDHLLTMKKIHRRSYSLICIENSLKIFTPKAIIFQFGERRVGDLLIHFQKEVVLGGELSMPKFTFDFDDFRTNVSYVAVTVDVSDLIDTFWLCELISGLFVFSLLGRSFFKIKSKCQIITFGQPFMDWSELHSSLN